MSYLFSIGLIVAKKEHRCDVCTRLIPKGTRYWRRFTEYVDDKEHTNCLEFETQPKVLNIREADGQLVQIGPNA